MLVLPKCFRCAHYDATKPKGSHHCKAFPDGISQQVLNWETPHNTTIEGQKGNFVFKALKNGNKES